MRILAIHSNGTIEGGADVVYIQGNRLLTERGHALAWLTIGTAPAADELNQPLFSLPEFRENGAFQKSIGLAAGHLYRRAARRLAEQAIQDFRPDVVHVHTIQGHLSPSVLLPFREEKIPIVQTLHDYRLLCPGIHFLSQGQVCEACKGHKYYRCLLKRCRKNEVVRSAVTALGSYVSDYLYRYDNLISTYIAPGEFLRQKMIEYGYPAEKIHRLPNAYFGPMPESVGAQRSHILFAGRLSREKGVDLLVRAAKDLRVPVKIAGDGAEGENLKAMAHQVGASNVHFLGFQNHAELRRLYQTALVTVLPSRWFENGPLVLLESYASATPVVGACIGAIPEFIASGETGYLFIPSDADDLHRVLGDCLAHPDALRRMGKTALARVQTQYSPEAYVAGLENILAGLLA